MVNIHKKLKLFLILLLLYLINISPFYLKFFYWRGEAQEASEQEEKKAVPQGSTDQEAEDQTAHQREDATGQSFHHRSVRHLLSFPSLII